MKVLFYSSYHFNADSYGPYLELIQEHLDKGDEVFFLGCNSEMPSCQPNPYHSKLICQTCISMRDSGLAAINGKVNLIKLREVLHIDEVDPQFEKIDYSSVKNLKDVDIDNFDIGMAIVSSVVSIFRDPSPDLQNNRSLIERQWHSSLYIYECVKKLIREHSFDRVHVFNARHATLRACLRACEYMGTDCYVIEAGKDRQTYSVYPNAMPHDRKHIRSIMENLWENGKADKESVAAAYYAKRSQGKDEQFGYFTADQERGKLPFQWNDSKWNIAIFVSSEDEFVAIGRDWENPLYKNQADGIRQITETLSENADINIYIRIHPNLKAILNESVAELYLLKNDRVFIIPADSDISSYTLMDHADRIVSFGSSVGIEAAAAGKVSVLAGQSFYKDLESTYNPENHEQLIEMLLDRTLLPKPKTGAYKFAYFLLNFGHSYKHYRYHNTFEGEVNGKTFRPALIFYIIRRIGRWLRLRKEKKQKLRITAELKKLA